ncbi:hypothetical protein [Flagellimonas myxillae]|uniref:hypothetical protein n=1 Tax=Flagellimonas myxillae TaxID=2942214 RepID=UPI00201EC458|nr:hypothetical protein [Muricauda myxillae]MCL6266618.1 hypothetical protein [Muricauda myxillae]
MGIFNFKRKKQTPQAFHKNTELIGIYSIPNHNDVNLVELIIEENVDDFDLGEITQEQKGQDKLNWQTAYDEKYLDENGSAIIGDDFEKPTGLKRFRVAFFFHFLDLKKPLICQYGLIKLVEITEFPDRLKKVIKYTPID